MTISTWLYFFDEIPSHTRASVTAALEQAKLTLHPFTSQPHGFGVVVFDRMDDANLRELRVMTRSATVLAISTAPAGLDSARMWEVLEAGAADLLLWSKLPAATDQVVSRLQRWDALQNLIESAPVKGTLIGKNPLWRNLVRSVVEVAAFTQASVLVTGETGTGKELIAHLIHDLDSRTNKGDLIVVDCTTLSPELSGSELFGHERGAFTGAVTARDGAFSLADGGTLFLDEVGELSLPLQAQLLRAVQEHKYKRVGGNTWQHTEFRLICATNRDMEADVAHGSFRADLYYRIAGCRCRTQSLRERRDDILLLVSHFLGQMDPQAEVAPRI
jgi:transcriptional regulator with GAF, ATPase, and Fis domain